MADDVARGAALGRVVRISVPSSIAFDFDKITKIKKDILGRLGCGGCHSSFDIRLLMHDDYIVDEKGNVHTGPILGG